MFSVGAQPAMLVGARPPTPMQAMFSFSLGDLKAARFSDGTPANPPAGIAPASSEPKKKCLRENRVGICSSSVQPPRRLRLRFRVSQIEVRYG
jgi:hypothetical protein